MFGLFERLLKIPPTMIRSAIVDDFMERLVQPAPAAP